MSHELVSQSYLSLRRTAQRIGVPAAWLKKEAQAGRVPCLRAGRRLLFNPVAVEKALAKRAVARQGGGHA